MAQGRVEADEREMAQSQNFKTRVRKEQEEKEREERAAGSASSEKQKTDSNSKSGDIRSFLQPSPVRPLINASLFMLVLIDNLPACPINNAPIMPESLVCEHGNGGCGKNSSGFRQMYMKNCNVRFSQAV